MYGYSPIETTGVPFAWPVQTAFGPDTVFFSSQHGVQHFCQGLAQQYGISAEAFLAQCKVLAIGPATAKALKAQNVPIDYIAQRHQAHSAIEDWLKQQQASGSSDRPRHILWPCGNRALDQWTTQLEHWGITCHPLVVYHTHPVSMTTGSIPTGNPLGAHPFQAFHWLAFTSPSSVESVFQTFGAPLATQKVAVIGPTTHQFYQATQGHTAQAVASPHSLAGMAQAILAFERQRPSALS